MKHIKDIELFENRNFKDYRQYEGFIKNKFDAHSVEVYDIDGIDGVIYINIVINPNPNPMTKENFMRLFDCFKDYDFKIFIKCNHINFKVVGDNKIFDQFNMEMDTNKYNL